jgi:ribosomal protein S17
MREQRRALVGTVTSDKMDKTVVVTIERVTRPRSTAKSFAATRSTRRTMPRTTVR